ncbi:unnamed protein product [Dibothriocephalus latus]|uniref:Phosphoribulokinase/uridine kinase domain-containing protein n=1 Tax=Dibothriocephalus latus TaxID=60516 RepID=A0A3P7LRB0_DIBLA|nr:unnamed protein product [Dibothriocephalus latus]
MEQVKNHTYNFDHPNAIDHELLINHLSRLREGKSIQVPEYDFKTHSRTSKTASGHSEQAWSLKPQTVNPIVFVIGVDSVDVYWTR